MMNSLGSFLFLLAISFFSTDVMAQTRCPTGVQAGGAQCLPDDEDSGPARPTGEWIKTWGALVSSNQGHGAWTSTGKTTEDAARQDALGKCRSTGASDCVVDMAYFNQCVAVAGSNGSGAGSIDTGKNESVASQRALDSCQKKSGFKCSVMYTDCTKPIFVKY
ncbi:DUF4189 domain-containing protein [Xanthomonas sp. 3307]|uniref:DUF4189 domain-containing protein n=1 Tax=Xanthomonas sp. 3307 TaxID=3035316 RepID=UPI0021A4AFD0|nr:DUF4189 domain-containing protein [Xanthomonas sp. 3307]